MFLDNNQEFDKKTKADFWDKNEKAYRIIMDESEKPFEQIKKFAKIIDDYDEKYDLRILSDNPQFDIGFINYYYAKFLDRNPLSYMTDGTFRPIYDTVSYIRGLMVMSYNNIFVNYNLVKNKFKLDIDIKPTHLPDDDAEYIYNMHFKLIKKVKTNK